MDQRRTILWVGLVLFVAGGAVLAWGGATTGTVLGTTMGLAGVGLVGWWWASAGRGNGGD